ncbi:MAG: tautomerase family protein [Oscillochloris sp.]|nr:tautomerase family protein [Oscillochloris sp.]
MAQVRIYGLRNQLASRKHALSDAIHMALMESFELPQEKRFQRFIMLEPDEFIFPADRSAAYTIIEFSIFAGRSPAAKKKLITSLFRLVAEQADITPQDLEITIYETPPANWGIRGKPGDELQLSYTITV